MTYSIVAVDTRTGEVGGAGTSCLGGSDVFVIYRGVPGRGVVHAQARYSVAAREQAAELLRQGHSAADVLATITSASFDGDVAVRQYGIVDLSGSALGFTGAAAMPFAGDLQGRVDGYAYSVQGNILTSAAVLQYSGAAFEAEGCDLAERLMRGLLAGESGGEGDSRCTPHGIPSDSAFLQVEQPNSQEGAGLALHVESSGSDNPLPLLREKLDAWRIAHPCPVELGLAGAPASTDPQRDAGGCACQLAAAAPDALLTCSLLGALLVVRWRRRAARQLRPALLA